MPFTLGLTGGIAGGKSLVGEYFRDKGITVIDADQISRDVVEPGTEALLALVTHFGPEILSSDGSMNRPYMRKRVFSDSSQRFKLEEILHPFIKNRLLKLRDNALHADHKPYCVLMIPLLVKFGWCNLVDRLLVIDCSEETQLKRLVNRDGIDKTLARNMLQSQDTRQQRLNAADDVILNEGSTEEIFNAITKLHLLYEQLGNGEINELEPQKF